MASGNARATNAIQQWWNRDNVPYYGERTPKLTYIMATSTQPLIRFEEARLLNLKAVAAALYIFANLFTFLALTWRFAWKSGQTSTIVMSSGLFHTVLFRRRLPDLISLEFVLSAGPLDILERRLHFSLGTLEDTNTRREWNARIVSAGACSWTWYTSTLDVFLEAQSVHVCMREQRTVRWHESCHRRSCRSFRTNDKTYTVDINYERSSWKMQQIARKVWFFS